MEKKKTLRMVFPQWQGGINPNYVFGSELLAYIAPPAQKMKPLKLRLIEILIRIYHQLTVLTPEIV